MSLFFAGTRDEALLAMAIEEASRAERVPFLRRTALQTIMYFLKVLGVPMDYRFDIHHYGPFCNGILQDTESLMADEVIVDRAQRGHYSNYAPGPAIGELLRMHADALEPHRGKIREVVSVLAPMSPEKLELLATLHFAFAAESASGGCGPWKDRVLRRFQAFKGGKFSTEDMSSGYDACVRAGLAAE